MKQKDLLKIAIALTLSLFLNSNLHSQAAGDIAFVGFNADGGDDFAIVTLTDLTANTKIWFTDSEPNAAGEIEPGEGRVEWDTGNSIIPAGSIIIFTDFGAIATRKASSGSVLNSDGSFGLSVSGEALYAYTGTTSTVTTWLAGIQNSTSTSNTVRGDLTNTGLTVGSTFVVFTASGNPDGGIFNGSRSNQSTYSNYLTQIGNSANWDNTTGDDDGELILPFSQEAFTINTTNWTGASSNVWNLAGNWDNGIPTSSSLATIPEVATAPALSTTATVGNLTITEADGLTINSGGSLIVNGTSTGNVTYKRTLTFDADEAKSWHLVSSPVNGENMTTMRANNSFLTKSNRNSFAPYDNSQALPNNRWAYFADNATTSLMNGKGYTAKLSSAGDISFTGTLNTSDIIIALTQGGASGNNFNLIGNPFTSSINSNTFLTSNTDELVQQDIYVWNEILEDYVTINTTSNFKVSPGQGFFVEANTTNNITISKAIQSHETDDFQKSARPEIKLNITDGSLTRYANIFYIDGTTTGFDNGYDGKLFGGVSQPFALYTHLVSDSEGKNFQLQSLPNLNHESMVIPVGVNAANGKEITFTADAMNLPENINVYLEDKELNTYTKLSQANASYKVTLTAAANGIGRFYLHTSAKSTLSITDLAIENISMYKTTNSNLRVVGLSEGKAKLKLFNLLGKEVVSTTFNTTGIKDITLPKLATGIYIVQLKTETGTLNKKITIE